MVNGNDNLLKLINNLFDGNEMIR